MIRITRRTLCYHLLGLLLLTLAVLSEKLLLTPDTYGRYRASIEQQTSLSASLQCSVSTSPTFSAVKTAYLTFDDGPSPNTGKILEILEKEQVPATFFLIGEQITPQTLPVLKKMKQQNHQLGLHTQSHSCSIYDSFETWKNDFLRAKQTVENYPEIWDNGNQTIPHAMRFPWGSTNGYLKPYKKEAVSFLNEQGFAYYDWNVSAEDSVGHPCVDSIISHVDQDYSRFTHPVILMHDSAINDETTKALPTIISHLKQAGYQFDVLGHMKEPFHY